MKKTILVSIAAITLSGLLAYAGDSKELYDKQCAKCHGAEGKGDTKMGQKLGVKDLSDAKKQADMTDEAIFKAIKQGVKDGGKTVMKGSENLSDQEVRELVSHVRKLKK